MLPRNHPDRIRIVFDDHRLVANAGLLLPATLARHLGLGNSSTITSTSAARRAGEQGGQDADAGGLRAGWRRLHRRRRCAAHRRDGRRSRLRGQGAIHPGHLPAQLPVGPRPPTGPGEPGVAGTGRRAGPGDGPFTIGLESTICETYGLAKEGARHHGYAGQRSYQPLLAVAAGTGDVLKAGCARAAPTPLSSAAHFLRETVSRVRYAGARRAAHVRADTGFYAHASVAVCREMDVRFSHHHPPARSLRIWWRRYPMRTGGLISSAM